MNLFIGVVKMNPLVKIDTVKMDFTIEIQTKQWFGTK
jgi:hypothetical protein